MLVGTHIVFHVEDGGGLLEGREGLFFCSLKSFFGFEVWYLMSVLTGCVAVGSIPRGWWWRPAGGGGREGGGGQGWRQPLTMTHCGQ